MSEIELPDDYKDKGWVGSILGEDGKVDIAKTLKKIDNQESMLGKKHIPGKDASDDEWREFAKKVTQDYSDSDYDAVLDGTETKAEMIAKFKENGMTPKQAKVAAEFAMKEKLKVVGEKYSVEVFQQKLLEKLPDDKARAKAKAVLVKSGQWDSLQEASNDEALNVILAASKIGVAYDVDDAAGKDAGTPNIVPGNGKSIKSQEFFDRCYELAQTMPRDEAYLQARREFTGE